MNSIVTNPNLPAWLIFFIIMLSMWGVLFFWGAHLLGGFGQPRTKILVRPLVVFSWLAAEWLQGRLYRSMLHQVRNGPDPFLKIMWPIEILVLLALAFRAARIVDRARAPHWQGQ
jgi:hypothetical protein